jgi:hypothetical protein
MRRKDEVGKSSFPFVPVANSCDSVPSVSSCKTDSEFGVNRAVSKFHNLAFGTVAAELVSIPPAAAQMLTRLTQLTAMPTRNPARTLIPLRSRLGA